MNPLASIAKNLRELSGTYSKIKNPETKGKAQVAIKSVLDEMCPVSCVSQWTESVPAALQASVTVSGVESRGETQTLSGAVSVAAVVELGEKGEAGPGVGWEEPAIVGDVNGTTGEFETVQVERSVELIGGWPVVGVVSVTGLAPNRRSIKGKLEDGRVVSVERSMGRQWKPGMEVKCRLVRAGSAPLFRAV